MQGAGGAFGVKMQATGAIRLDQLPELMMQLGSAQNGERRKDTKARQKGRDQILPNVKFQGVADELSAAPGRVDTALRGFLQANANNPAVVGMGDRGALRGLLSLLSCQLNLYATKAMGPYLKAMSPIMPRTNFAGMFNSLPDQQKTVLAANNAALWLDVVGRTVPAVDLNQQVIAFPSQTWAVDLVRADWLRGMTNNEDRLTQRWQRAQISDELVPLFSDEMDEPDEAITNAEYLEGVGSLGTKTESVEKRARTVAAPIFELRTIQQNAGSSTMPFDEAMDAALKVHKWMAKLKRGKRATYGD